VHNKRVYIYRTCTDSDFDTEYLANCLNIKVVDGVDEAIEHIPKFGSQHSEAIVTENYTVAEKFLNLVDAACVYVMLVLDLQMVECLDLVLRLEYLQISYMQEVLWV